MKPLLLSLVSLLVLVAAPPAARGQAPPAAAPEQSGLVYSGSSSIWVHAPPGWILDPDAGQAQGVLATLYRRGESWEHGEAVMYVSVYEPDSGETRTVTAVIASETADWRGKAPDMVVSVADSVRADSGGVAAVRRFDSRKKGIYDVVAYLQDGRSVWGLVMTARTKSAEDGAYDSFVRFVRSYLPGSRVLRGKWTSGHQGA